MNRVKNTYNQNLAIFVEFLVIDIVSVSEKIFWQWLVNFIYASLSYFIAI